MTPSCLYVSRCYSMSSTTAEVPPDDQVTAKELQLRLHARADLSPTPTGKLTLPPPLDDHDQDSMEPIAEG